MTTIPEQIIGRYAGRTAASHAFTERASQVLPGGDTRTGVFYAPYPAYMVAGQGNIVTDLDGNQYLDLMNNYTSLVHGHAHPALLEAARGQLPNGAVYASPMVGQVELAELICARVPSAEQLRFTNSGTEATMLALRAARAYTERSGIIKMRGAYHGSHDLSAATADPEADRGVPAGLHHDLFFAPFNDLPAVEALLEAHPAAIAAIIVEPVPNAGGLPLPLPGYLQGLRDLADQYGALLIFDEVVTLRLHEGGYQAIAGVTPDLTAMGKIIGGGFAVGAFGGRRAILEQFNPARPDHLAHSGTFNGHSVTMAAGLASLRLLDQAAIDRINALGASLARGFDDAFAEAGIAGSTTSAGSLVQVHWRTGPIQNMDDVGAGFRTAGDLPLLLHLELMNRGIYAAARGEYNISTAMTADDVARAVDTFSAALHVLKPYVAEAYPALCS
ncbi:MAG TPA: aminotransferase class III-fold pyridoxal phosphate-dependent enzyme [Roseiflexaceae bacterium]|nr:aminotransferase class III-fold pyridoxal phosphate-dependent enzyme [Roseiflexaceae bacterium]